MVDEHQLRVLVARALQHRQVGGHAGDHRVGVRNARDLKTVVSIVGEAMRLEELVQVSQDVGDAGQGQEGLKTVR